MIDHGHGGARKGAGRKPGSNRYGEPTTPLRVPNSCVPAVQDMLDNVVALRAVSGANDTLDMLVPAEHPTALARPLFSSSVAAGFPSPADDYVEGQLDLNKYLVDQPAATFYVRVSGESMSGAGIFPNDILVVNRSKAAKHKSIVIAIVETELTVKRLWKAGGITELRPENPAFTPLRFSKDMELTIWGVVAGVVRKF